jgi:hypothetical protein
MMEFLKPPLSGRKLKIHCVRASLREYEEETVV